MIGPSGSNPALPTGLKWQGDATELQDIDTDEHTPSTHATRCHTGPRHRGREAGPSYLSAPGIPQAHLQTLATGFSPSVPLPAPHLEHGGSGRAQPRTALSCQSGTGIAALLSLSLRVWNQLQVMLREHHVLPPTPYHFTNKETEGQKATQDLPTASQPSLPPLASARLEETGEKWPLILMSSERLLCQVLSTPISSDPPLGSRDHHLCLKVRKQGWRGTVSYPRPHSSVSLKPRLFFPLTGLTPNSHAHQL